MTMTLGLFCHQVHESAAVLVRDGKVVAAAEEERFSRKKMDSSYPRNAIDYCLKQGCISGKQLDAVGYGWAAGSRLASKASFFVRHLPKSLSMLPMMRTMSGRTGEVEGLARRHLGFDGPFLRLNHHLCHAASALFSSSFDRAAILTIDGSGEWECAWGGVGDGRRLENLWVVDWPHSLGHVYAALTEYLGFEPLFDEYKVMGLAAYGEPRYMEQIEQLFFPTPDGYRVDERFFNFHLSRRPRYGQRLVEMFGPPVGKSCEKIPERYRHIAASLQAQAERVMLHLVERLVKETGLRRLCLAGGVAMNSVANGRIVREGLVDEIYVPPCASDSGAALGAAYLAQLSLDGQTRPEPAPSALLGPEFDDSQIVQALSDRHLVFRAVEAPAETAAQLLAQGKVIGWFQGRMEFGQRALGARSILADPRRAEMKDVVNEKIKFREEFRPFAPAILAEKQTEYFEHSSPSPFMTQVYPIRQEKWEVIPAVTHVDGTGRVQTVGDESNALFRELIRCFDEMTGVPVVLNTSFNVKGEPIVNTPGEALDTFLRTDMDAVILGNHLAMKA